MPGTEQTQNEFGASRVLLETKLYMPSPRPNAVSRPRLIDLLDRARNARLILISGPAGFGKTSLMAEWLSAKPNTACWLSLDATDNDPGVFLGYLIAALQTVHPGAGRGVSPLLRSSQLPPVEDLVSLILNDLASVARDIVVALDDYHSITDPAIHSAVALFLERMPPQVQLAIATRFDPPFPLARLRAQGRMVEVRAGSLRFTPEEASSFLNDSMGLALPDDEVLTLAGRTEGWAAGLQMAALSLQGRSDKAAFIAEFAGTNRFILDFLIEEVLSHEPEEVRDFLLQTSLLERLCGPLCEHVADGELGVSGSEMLEGLERRNLFVVGLDEERKWYRYHHLFAEVLQSQLRRVQPEIVETLHRRASEWYESQGLADPAFNHAAAAADWPRAARLVAANWMPVGHTGRAATVLRWLQALPEDLVRSDPWLSTAFAWILWLVADIEGARERADEARALLDDPARAGMFAPPQGAVMSSGLASLRSLLARQMGEVETALAAAEESIREAPEDMPLLKGLGFSAMGHSLGELGDTEGCVDSLRTAIPLLWQGANHFAAMAAAFSVAKNERLRGHLREPFELCRSLLARTDDEGLAGDPAVGALHLGMALLSLEQDRLEEAKHHLELAEQLGRHAGLVDILVGYAATLARLKLAEGDLPGALAALGKVESKVGGAPLAAAELRAFRARLSLAEGDLDQARSWAQWAEHRPGDDRGHTREHEATVIARVRLAEGKPGEALRLLRKGLEAAESQGRKGRALEVHLLSALVSMDGGDPAAALAELGIALDLAEPEGYTLTFLEEGEPLRLLLERRAAATTWSERANRHAAHLLASLSPDADITSPGPLSDRELEVLRLIAAGRSNKEIAAALWLTLNTVKKHSSNIFSKLGAGSRTEAVAIAREQGLL